MWWFMLGCVAFRVCCHSGSAHKCRMRRIWVLRTGLDLAAGGLCIEWWMGEAKMVVKHCRVCDKKRWVVEYGL